ncbi:MAG TPA: glycoside hydrolase family 2 TIM barrel-domain containing protein [Opitutus sp.]|nr:glycoside hydrolase family 2 TIM barrel-domain containing protein [Opitutus sp.]
MRHETRPVTLLNGLWDFAFLGPIDVDAFVPADARLEEKQPVPSAFDALPAHAGRRGAAVYRRRFPVPAGRPARIEFGAVSLWTRVFVDGVPQREHACGYAPFAVEVPPAAAAERELVVLVDNRFDFDRVPKHEEYFDFYQYGGILRDVALHVLPAGGPFLDHVRVAPAADYRGGGVEVTIELGGAAAGAFAVTTRFDDAGPQRHENPRVESGRIVLALRVPAPRLWSPETPALHTLRVGLEMAPGAPVDDAIVRFGLRRIEAGAGGLRLNGAPLKLRGYNRHEWHPNFGPCTPVLQMAADLQLLRDLGCNFIRGAHYPQDQHFLDLCDELGFLVWEENLGWGQREKTFASEKFRRDHRTALRAMVRASVNHPSVIVWGFLNEAGTDAGYVRPVIEETVATLRALDPTRLVSYASMFALTDRHFDLVDLIALNLYPGWYGCEGVGAPLELIAPAIRETLARIDAAGFGDKPVIISEIGAEALYGWRDAHGDFFTEAYQAEYLRRACVEALANPRCSGIALWQFSDVRTYGGGWSLKRPRTYNNKGSFDEYRRPKAACAAVREVFRSHAGPPNA